MSGSANIIVLGGGGHASLIATILCRTGHRVLGHVSPEPGAPRAWSGIGPWLGDDDWLASSDIRDTLFVNGIGSVARPDTRRLAFSSAHDAGCRFMNVIHASAIVDDDTDLGSGIQIMASGVVQPGCTFGDNVLVNTGAVLEHGVTVASHTHVAPRACVCGGATVGENVHIGAGAVVLEGRVIAPGAVVGAGSIVTRDVPRDAIVVGNPARAMTSGSST